MTIAPHLETTPKAYYKDYVTATPNYDLYPGLSRRLGNGYVHRPSPPVRRQPKDTNFITMNLHPASNSRSISVPMATASETAHSMTVSDQQLISHAQDSHPSWDLYPSILRNVENFGTDQMRQQLHAMETTTM
ncbi:hypothetical protein [Absidia glauca]|uniref:Uncharacterized protein n=1 Tax=Absidia glauca TaxID=4829 RepID=A0A163K3D1_ABSGL|nr:hypothetical protein [Absidia glauca]